MMGCLFRKHIVNWSWDFFLVQQPKTRQDVVIQARYGYCLRCGRLMAEAEKMPEGFDPTRRMV